MEWKVDKDTQLVKVRTTGKETFFVSCQPRDIAHYLKMFVARVKGVQTTDIKLYTNGRLLEEESTLYDQQVGNHSVVNVIFRLPNGDWEKPTNFEVNIPTNSLDEARRNPDVYLPTT